jgi:hypothetical protein
VSGVRRLVARFERSLDESSEPPSLADIERLLRIKRQLDTMETIERLLGQLRPIPQCSATLDHLRSAEVSSGGQKFGQRFGASLENAPRKKARNGER